MCSWSVAVQIPDGVARLGFVVFYDHHFGFVGVDFTRQQVAVYDSIESSTVPDRGPRLCKGREVTDVRGFVRVPHPE
jgi:hypothetical protein